MLRKVLNFVFGIFYYVPSSAVTELKNKNEDLLRAVKLLEEEVLALKDENSSVWEMIDEMNGSSKIKGENVRELLDDLKDALTDEMLKDFKAVGEA